MAKNQAVRFKPLSAHFPVAIVLPLFHLKLPCRYSVIARGCGLSLRPVSGYRNFYALACRKASLLYMRKKITQPTFYVLDVPLHVFFFYSTVSLNGTDYSGEFV